MIRARASCFASRWAAVAMALGILAIAPATHAQATDKAGAEALFDQGKRLMTEGKYSDACPKFAESLRLDAGVGTSLWLAECYEKNGQTATAWAQFREAAALAVKMADAREKTARERAKSLEPRLSKLVIVVPPSANVAGLEVKKDGIVVGAALWGSEIPSDPGRHTITATAPARQTWETSATVPPNAQSATVNVPLLEEAKVATPPVPDRSTNDGRSGTPENPPPPGEPVSDGHSQRTAAYVVGGVGVVGVGIGTVFGLVARSKLHASTADNLHCSPNLQCDLEGVNDRSAAKTDATLSTVSFVVGGAALATAVILYVTAPKGSVATGVRVVPSVVAKGGGLVLAGSW